MGAIMGAMGVAAIGAPGALVLDPGAGRAKSPVSRVIGAEPEGRTRWR